MPIPPKRRLWGKYIESPPPGVSGAHGLINEFILAIVVTPIVWAFCLYCWLTEEKPVTQ